MYEDKFFVTRPVGAGHSQPNDVIRTRKALTRTGHGTSPPSPSGRFDSSAFERIQSFQKDFGLKQDGVINPGGPTAGALNVALAAEEAGGKEGIGAIRKPFAALSRAGFKLRPDPDDRTAPGAWADSDGRNLTSTRRDQILKRAGVPPTPPAADANGRMADLRNRLLGSGKAAAKSEAKPAAPDPATPRRAEKEIEWEAVQSFAGKRGAQIQDPRSHPNRPPKPDDRNRRPLLQTGMVAA